MTHQHFLFSVPENAEHVDEEIDEIEVEGEGADDGDFLAVIGGACVVGKCDFANSGRIVGGEADENQDAHVGEQELEHRVFKKEIDKRRDDDAEESHEAEVSHAGEIRLRHVSVRTHNGKRAGRRQKNAGDAGECVENEYGGKREPIQYGIGKEHGRRRFQRHAGHGGGEMPHERQRRKKKRPDGEFAGENDAEQRRAGGNEPRGRTGDEERNGHPCVNVAHETGHIDRKSALIS